MKKFKKWTSEEINDLVQSLGDNPHNKMEVFRQHATKYGRTHRAVSQRWYATYSNPESKHYVGSCFTMIGRKCRLDNRGASRYAGKTKNCIPIKHKPNIWDRIKSILGI